MKNTRCSVAQWLRRLSQQTEHSERYNAVGGNIAATIDATSGPEPLTDHARHNRACALTRYAIRNPHGFGKTLARITIEGGAK